MPLIAYFPSLYSSWAVESPIPNLDNIELNILMETVFVSISATWSSDCTKRSSMTPLSSFSFMKCLYILTCLVRSRCIGFYEKLIVTLLSHINCASSLATFFSHNTSPTPFPISPNFASVLDNATTSYFLLLHVMRLPPTSAKYHKVDHLSFGLSDQSASI